MAKIPQLGRSWKETVAKNAAHPLEKVIEAYTSGNSFKGGLAAPLKKVVGAAAQADRAMGSAGFMLPKETMENAANAASDAMTSKAVKQARVKVTRRGA